MRATERVGGSGRDLDPSQIGPVEPSGLRPTYLVKSAHTEIKKGVFVKFYNF
jgi:hypothetical protein